MCDMCHIRRLTQYIQAILFHLTLTRTDVICCWTCLWWIRLSIDDLCNKQEERERAYSYI